VVATAEAYIEFEEEEEGRGELMGKVGERVSKLVQRLEGVLNDGRKGEIVREGLRVAVVGPPNVGKSSLVNLLAKRDVAIVSEVPGRKTI
jgi:tRNA modification GTPase